MSAVQVMADDPFGCRRDQSVSQQSLFISHSAASKIKSKLRQMGDRTHVFNLRWQATLSAINKSRTYLPFFSNGVTA